MINHFFFCIFRNSKTHSFFLTSKNHLFSNPNDVVKFIDMQKEKPFFHSFPIILFLENQNTRASVLLLTYKKKHENRGISSRVLTSGNFAKGMTLPKAGSLSLLYAWFWLHIG